MPLDLVVFRAPGPKTSVILLFLKKYLTFFLFYSIIYIESEEQNMTKAEAIKYGTAWLKDEYLDAKDYAFLKIALEALDKCNKIEKIIDSNDADFIANYVRGLFSE